MDTLRERLVVLCTTHRLESVRVRDGDDDDDEIVEVKRMRMRRMESRDDDVRRRATTCDVRQNQGSGEIGRRRVGMGIPKRRVRQARSASGDPSRVQLVWTFFLLFHQVPSPNFARFRLFAAYRCFIPLIKMVKSEALACP